LLKTGGGCAVLCVFRVFEEGDKGRRIELLNLVTGWRFAQSRCGHEMTPWWNVSLAAVICLIKIGGSRFNTLILQKEPPGDIEAPRSAASASSGQVNLEFILYLPRLYKNLQRLLAILLSFDLFIV